MKPPADALEDPLHREAVQRFLRAKEAFIAEWGAVGSSWGINRSMAQIHALLMVSAEPLSTDDIMRELHASRGNVHANVKELLDWGLIRSVLKKGDRKEYFEAEKDVWKMFCTISRQRKRREIEPVQRVLSRCESDTRDLGCPEALAFHQQVKALGEFVQTISSLLDSVSCDGKRHAIGMILKLVG
jgi:DNA-binding transcriptional regulator GbsR (MarR family)